MPINQLSTANTFSQWLTATQALIETANTLTNGNGSTFIANTILEISGTGSRLNVRTSGAINVLFSNTATIANVISTNVFSTTVNVSNTIVFSDNTTLNSNVIIVRSFSQANAAFIQANTPSHVANSAAVYANSALEAANTGLVTVVGVYTNAAFSTANSAGAYANAGFIVANTSGTNAVNAGTYANAGFGVANTSATVGVYANASFIQANTSTTVGVYANASFIKANAAFIRANNSLDANTGGTVTGAVSISTGISGTSLTASANIVAPLFVGTATSARYADLAEKYLADAEYPIGTVVCVGGEKEVTESYMVSRPIGVVSKNPAYMMNSELEGGTYIALKGRVPIRVIGTISKGQPLIPSHINGVARQGTWNDNYFAVSLESSDAYEERLVEGVVI